VALFASACLPGLGQLYNGEPGKALAFWLVLVAGPPALIWVSLSAPARFTWWGPAGGFLLMIANYLVGLADAARSARRIGDRFTPRFYQHRLVYAVALLAFGSLAAAASAYARHHGLHSYVIRAQSMAPALLPGDRVLVDQRLSGKAKAGLLRHGDIVLLDRDGTYGVSRVIGLPGERIELHDTDVFRDGRALRASSDDSDRSLPPELLRDHFCRRESAGALEYPVLWKRVAGSRPSVDKTVPPGQIFVLADNRDGGADSRLWGPVPESAVIGIPRQIWLSTDPQGRPRWARWGLVVAPAP
jgi:signal peptidase I